MMVDAYASKVLSKDHHERLVANLDQFARDANIPAHWIYSHLPSEIPSAVKDYLRGFKRIAAKGLLGGLCFTRKGMHGMTPDQVMSALAGCLVRNFVRARVMTVTSVLQDVKDRNAPDVSCLLIPNFFYSVAEGGGLAAWEISALHDLLVSRRVTGMQTFVYASDLSLLGKEYGVSMQEMLTTNFTVIGG